METAYEITLISKNLDHKIIKYCVTESIDEANSFAESLVSELNSQSSEHISDWDYTLKITTIRG